MGMELNKYLMKTTKLWVAALVLAGFVASPLALRAEEAKKDNYPLTTCVVSGDKLGEMGKPYVYTYEGREIHFCCKGCVKDFNKDPKKFLKKLDDAEKAAKK